MSGFDLDASVDAGLPECTQDFDCLLPQRPICDPSSRTCVECYDDNQCGGDLERDMCSVEESLLHGAL